MKYKVKSVYKKIKLEDITSFIKYERIRRGYTYRDLGNLSGLAASTIYRIENSGNPKLTSLIKIYAALGYKLTISSKGIKIKNI